MRLKFIKYISLLPLFNIYFFNLIMFNQFEDKILGSWSFEVKSGNKVSLKKII